MKNTTEASALVCLIPGTALDTESLIGYGDWQWNLKLRKGQETAITCSLHVYRSIFVTIKVLFHILYYYRGEEYGLLYQGLSLIDVHCILFPGFLL